MLSVASLSLLTTLVASSGVALDRLDWIRASNVVGDFHFYDEQGRVRIFHGGNRVQKAPPWYIEDMYESDAEADHMQLLGVSVVRLGFMWSGYNPAPGVFNQTYIDVIKSTVRRLERKGIYSLLNVQMDGLSSKFCTYDGAPRWVIDKSKPKHTFPWPLQDNCSQGGGPVDIHITTEASATAYQDIFDNNHGMLDDFTAFWSHAARQFKDMSGIIGYDVINEPFAGDFYKDPALLLPGVAGSKNLQRMYDILAAAIREHDDRHIIFYEPVTWGMIFSKSVFGSGFSHVPGGDVYRNRSAYSYHYYCHTFLPSYNDHPLFQRIVCDDTLAPLVWHSVKEDVKRVGGAAMMTEGMECPGVQSECETNMQQLDDHLFSWTDWDFAMDNDTKAESWARTHARAVAGVPLSMTFEPDSKDFNFCFLVDSSIEAPTEIFASVTFSYPDGQSVTTSGQVQATVDGDLVSVFPLSDGAHGSKACVHISRTSAVVQIV